MTTETTRGGAAALPLLSTKAVARQFGLRHRTLEDWRLTGNGPPFLKLGRRVLYRTEDLLRFLEERVRYNTGQRAAP